jgi:hypothetical protein
MFQSSYCMNHLFWIMGKDGIVGLLPSHVSIVLRLRCGNGVFCVFGTFGRSRSSRTCMALFVCLPLAVMLLQKTIAADTVTVCASYLRVSFFCCCCSRHACGLACVVFSRVLLRRYRSACYISAARMRFARLYIVLHTCGIRMRIRYDLL